MKLSIVIPVYNSSKILNTLLQNIKKNIFYSKNEFEVILVNDHSLDKSWDQIKILKKKYPFVRGLNLAKNYGQHSAIFSGLKLCKGEYIVCMDDDMQHHPKHIPNMLIQLKNYEVCYVKYINREHNFFKILISRLNNIVSSYLMNKSSRIYTSSFKCFKKSLNKKIIINNDSHIFLDYWIFLYSKSITFIDIAHNKRLFGKTNYGLKQLLTLWSKMIFLIEPKKKGLRYFFILIIRIFFKIFLKNYINYKKSENIKIQNII